MTTRVLTFREAIREALIEAMKKDADVILLGEDITSGGRFKITEGLAERFGADRVLDTPIIEDMLVGIGVGGALGGLRPIIEFMHPFFVALGIDDIARLNAWRYRMMQKDGPRVIVRAPFGAYDRGRGTEISGSMLGWFTHMPGAQVVVPSRPSSAGGLFRTALRQKKPVLFFEHKMLYEDAEEVPEGYRKLFGKADILRHGDAVTLVSWGHTLKLAREAATLLDAEGIHIELVDPNTLVPLDLETILDSAKKTGRLLIVEEDIVRGGIGAEIAASVAEAAPGVLVRRLGSKNLPLPPGPWEKLILPQIADIAEAARSLTANPRAHDPA